MKLFDDMEVDFRSIVQRLTESMVESKLISDTNTGSIAKLMAESFAREMAVFYSIMEKAHDAGYLESAAGPALEKVVAVLGMQRAQGELLKGRVVFSRGTPAGQDIGIPVGTKVTGSANGGVLPMLETVEPAFILSGQQSVSVRVQEIPGDEESEIDSLSVNVLNILPRPLMGVETVGNPEPITRSGKPEEDDHLRARAEAILRETQSCSVEAIEATVRGLGIETVKVVESPNGLLGCMEILLDDPELQKNPKREVQIRQALRQVKAAGIHMTIKMLRALYCQPIITVTLADNDLEEENFEKLMEKIKEDVTGYINETTPGLPVSKEKLKGIVISNTVIEEVVEVEMKAVLIKYTADGNEKLEWKKNAWEIDSLENAMVDTKRWPVMVVRKWPLKARMNLAVTLPPGLSEDEVRKEVRDVTDTYISSVITSMKIDFKELRNRLTEKFENLTLEPTWIIRQSDGRVEDLNEEHSVSLENGEQLTVDTIDVTFAEVKGNG